MTRKVNDGDRVFLAPGGPNDLKAECEVGGLLHIETVIAALYLRGLPRTHSLKGRMWQGVAAALRHEPFELGNAWQVLQTKGFWLESATLQLEGLLASAEELVLKGSVLTAVTPGYPSRWLAILGESAPPALWMRGEMPSGPFFTVVGSREISWLTRLFAEQAAAHAVRLGYSIVSGGAAGSDRAAAKGAGLACRFESPHPRPLVEIVPCGLDSGCSGFMTGSMDRKPDGCLLSVCAPQEGFGTAAAMERNALLYAASDHSLVIEARYKAGGTWHGATAAMRRKLTQVIVRDSPENAGFSALVALGAVPLRLATDLKSAIELAPAPLQLRLSVV